MSNKSKKKNKTSVETRREEIRKLNELKNRLENDLKILQAEKNKQFRRRNIRVVGHTCNFLSPFVLSIGMTVGLFKLVGLGFPFHTDTIEKYKVYNLDSQTNAYVNMDDEYINYSTLNGIGTNKLVVYSPWENQDDKYFRFKREYNLGTLKTLDLFNAVLNEDYGYIEENMTDYKEEIQTSNKINLNEPNDYIIQASLHMLDKEDTLKLNETDLTNIIVTLAEIVIALIFGGGIAYNRNFSYLYRMKHVNDDYKIAVRRVSLTEEDIKEVNQKILSLTRKNGGI